MARTANITKQKNGITMNSINRTDLSRVSELIVKGIDCWIEAGEIIAKTLEEHPDSMSRICEVTGLSEDIIRRFEQIGRKEIYPRLLANTSIGYRRLVSCTYREQKHYCDNPVELLVADNGKADTLRVEVAHVTPEQARQVFAHDHVRTLAEQRAWLESERKRSVETAMREKAEIQESAFVIRGGRVTFNKGCEMTAREIAELLSRMTK